LSGHGKVLGNSACRSKIGGRAACAFWLLLLGCPAAAATAGAAATIITAATAAASTVAASAAAADEPAALHAGEGVFDFTAWQGPALRVHYSLPEAADRQTQILFVMHGRSRDADRYLREWRDIARGERLLLLVPELDEAHFPGVLYSYGGMLSSEGEPRPRELWTFNVVEKLFDDVRRRTGNRSDTYWLFGHSAGGQFVHRFVLAMPDARYSRAIAANTGWYTMPVFEAIFPHGLHDSPIDREMLARALGRSLTVLLGTADNDPNHKSLNRDPGAMTQGPHRLSRGQSFHAAARVQAKALGVTFNWRLELAPGVAHSNGRIVPFAVKAFRRAGEREQSAGERSAEVPGDRPPRSFAQLAQLADESPGFLSRSVSREGSDIDATRTIEHCLISSRRSPRREPGAPRWEMRQCP
jgi:poly(3-hydroxybutyrate) depolymerase